MKMIVVLVILMASSRCYAIPSAYRQVADEVNVPVDILYAIAFTESGYQYQTVYNPWPWTLNIEGKAYRFTNRHSMLVKLKQAIQDKRSVDIGIMQINWRWHKHRFESPQRDIKSPQRNIESLQPSDSLKPALDPYTNLKTGAEILVEQYQETGDWWLAVGRYHSPGQTKRSIKRAKRYRQRVRQHWLRIKKSTLTTIPAATIQSPITPSPIK